MKPRRAQRFFAIRKPGSSPNKPGVSRASRAQLMLPDYDRRRLGTAAGRHPPNLMNGVGAHEIIVETPRHDRSLHELEVPELSNVIRAYKSRIIDLEGDKRMRYVLIFKNQGKEAGAHTISHSISQLMALSVTPGAVKTKLMIARGILCVKERCLYCDVLQQELKHRKALGG